MNACAPRAAITITPTLTLTAPAGVLWSQSGNYVFISTKGAATTVINVDLKSPNAAGTAVNTLANNLCTASWHSYSNLFWGWLTLAAPTAAPTNTGPYCSGGTIALTSNPATTNAAATPAITYTYAWTGTGTFSSTTAANPTVTSGATGNYNVVVTDNYKCPSTSVATAVTIKAALSAGVPTATVAACGTGTGTPVPYADLSAAAPAGGTSGVWSVTGSGTVTTPTSNTTQITGLSTTGASTSLTWAVSYTALPACTATSGSIFATPPNMANLTAVSTDYTTTGTSTTKPPTKSGCKTCSLKDGTTYTYYDATGRIIAKILDITNAIDLSATEVCVGYDYTPPATPTTADVQTVTENYYGTQQPFLPRRWTISPATNSTATVTLYFTNDELVALGNKALGTLFQISTYNPLVVTKYPGGSTNSYTAPATAGGVVVPATFSGYNSDHQVTFDVSSFSTFYIHPTIFPNAPLPVELISFTGVNIGNRNQLNWSTASEINSKKFIVEKSNGGSWSYVGELAAAGNSNIPIAYQFFDILPFLGNNFYRLKIVDLDEKYTYSNTINIPLTESVSNGISSVYPNPTSGLFDVQIQANSNYASTLSMFDVTGRNVFELPINLTSGFNTTHLDVSFLDKGVYLIQFKDVYNKMHVAKFVKQ